jgi:hypothetical protein
LAFSITIFTSLSVVVTSASGSLSDEIVGVLPKNLHLEMRDFTLDPYLISFFFNFSRRDLDFSLT